MKRFLAISIGIFFFTACLLHFWYPNPWNHGIFAARQSPNVQSGHAIGLALYSYANEHGGSYPSGTSSTEVFQILLDGGYATNPRIFYIPMPGKIAPQAGQKLKPENVGWDFTAGATLHSPAVLPLVFTTGYRVTYAPGASAVPMIKPYPRYDVPARTWAEWWYGHPKVNDDPGIAAFYINCSRRFTKLMRAMDSNSIPNFIPRGFVPDGKTYRQLTPDGVLPPRSL